ncbi:hypothetical protein PAAG_00766 [Paracoccidioides lutzii Pb01]|uniref:Uncharacterized protein n=1 Tax=Paracoccidioides lutzii (strain ATCC MYA-826 / Pb01) TaxID=502779 RepID=C1GQH1_PARBA|nr:hypothetical protein PAAG_00766 [Paracoccidioides lutzii Pb01]EEH37845.2 hypothetical protein PAAG_00766 [Paracoccidioides lutzii Pb01]
MEQRPIRRSGGRSSMNMGQLKTHETENPNEELERYHEGGESVLEERLRQEDDVIAIAMLKVLHELRQHMKLVQDV